jgi:hypothetical protein
MYFIIKHTRIQSLDCSFYDAGLKTPYGFGCGQANGKGNGRGRRNVTRNGIWI